MRFPSKACTPRPVRASSRPRSRIARRSKPPTARRCSRPSPRSSRSAVAGWRPSWRNGRNELCPARADICTYRCRPQGQARLPRRREAARHVGRMRWFVGGQQALMPEFLAMVAATVNSYSRLMPGFWAPTDATWGVENRTCALRVIPGGPEPARRVSDRGRRHQSLYRARRGHRFRALGIEHRSSRTRPIEGNAYDRRTSGAAAPCPRTLTRRRSASSRRNRRARSSATPSSSITPRPANGRSASSASAITDWELARYFEII